MENYIVTGATGFVGNNFITRLLKEKDCSITAVVLPDDDISYLKGKNINIVYGNVLDLDFLKSVIKSGSTVFHFAGIVDIGSGNMEMLYKVNVEGTKNVCEACFINGVKKLVHTSSVHAVRPLPHGEVMSEPTEFDADKVIGDYAKSKTMATKIVFEYAKKGLDVSVIYPAGITGPQDYKVSSLGQFVLDLVNEKIKGRVQGKYNFVDVRDVAEGAFLASKKGKKGEGYLLTGNVVTVDEIFDCVRGYMGRKNKIVKYPLWLLKFLTPLFETGAKLVKKRPLFTKYSLYTINENCEFSNQKAKKELGYNPMQATQSLIDSVNWYANNMPQLINPKYLQIIKNNIK